MGYPPDPVLSPPADGAPGLSWRWTAAGVVLGCVLIWSLVAIVEAEPPRPDVAVLIGALTFALTGTLVGYHSPGETVAEAALAGGIVGVATAVGLTVVLGYPIPGVTLAIGWIAVTLLSALGGWVGEVLQGTLRLGEDGPAPISWPWIAVGLILGVVLNGYSVFVVNAVLHPPGLLLLVSFLASFVLAGFFVGYFSPGVTIVEPAVAALLIVAVDAVLILIIFHSPFPLAWIVLGGGIGFLMALGGGWLGEIVQERAARRAGSTAVR